MGQTLLHRLGCTLKRCLTDFMRPVEPSGTPAPDPAFPVHWVTSHLGAGPAPHARAHLKALSAQGIQCILNLCDELTELANIEREAGFEVYHLPIIDEEAPELEALDKALEWVDEALFLGKHVYVHCRHGIGRTGTVLNAYLLRKGLGHQLAARTLKRLRSQPANYDQWRTVRRYGRQNTPLTVCEPSLEFGKTVDLAPFITSYLALETQVETALDSLPPFPRCGRDHSQCCRSPVSLTLIEALVLSSRINTLIPATERSEIIRRAVDASRRERNARKGLAGDYCLSAADTLCPLNTESAAPQEDAPAQHGHDAEQHDHDAELSAAPQEAHPNGAVCSDLCMLYTYRPLKCRLFGLGETQSAALWQEQLVEPLKELSAQVFLALSGNLPEADPLRFSLPDVLSGKYVQTVFQKMLCAKDVCCTPLSSADSAE
ncbi:protein-tyrosine phosphatase family protein [Desulfovibrio psychrotolerans]|uniref:Protein phosphatase n=1 Tax=Desulfovibrio psychrotolerans TaxID=415242 RepID=A0A7J0BY59_9BACT|nr:dual specificity protein phosphatase family protein [Desulfovibrio psychrotolerans]GFM37934.1 protein phosphatase [Desulfovibrio psychrotolerans]